MLSVVIIVMLSVITVFVALGGLLAIVGYSCDVVRKIKVTVLEVRHQDLKEDREALDLELYEQVSRAKVAKYCRSMSKD